jgi:multisubunit Na+/H+ antiporter MnhC subunit
MFKIRGADGKEYGPVAIYQIREWIREGRANQGTMAQQVGDMDWKPLGQYAEFADLPGAKSPVVTPGSADMATSPDVASGADSAARARAVQMVNGPAIGLIIAMVLGIALSALGIVFHLLGVSWGRPPPMMNPEAERMYQLFHQFGGTLGITAGVISIAIGLFVLFGALKMQKLSNHGLAMAAAIVAMIPCFSPCCLLGLPFGIWALVVLNKPEVKSQFA